MIFNMKYTLISFFAVALFFVSCTNSGSERDLKSYMSSYLKDNPNVVAFGNAKLKTILNKIDYKSFDKLGDVIQSQLDELEGAIDLDAPVFYTANAPFDDEGSPQSVTLLLTILDQEKLDKKLLEMGYDLSQTDDFKYTEDGDMMLGIRGNLALVVVQGGDVDAKTELSKHFKLVDQSESDDKIADILKTDSDILFGMSMLNIYNSSPEKQNLEKEKQEELSKLLENSYTLTSFRFEDGAAIVEVDNLFSEELNKRMFMERQSKVDILDKLGTGKPRIGLAFNLDLKKMEDLLNEFSPGMLDEIGGPQVGMAKMMSGASNLDDLLTGKAGFLMFGEPNEFGAIEPQFSAFVGLRPKAEEMAKSSTSFFNAENQFFVDQNGITFSTVQEKGVKLNLPKGAEDFGKAGISLFIDLEGLNPDDVIEMTNVEELESILKVSRFISFEYGNEGGQLKIIAKKGKENILKQLVEVHVDDLIEEMNNVSI